MATATLAAFDEKHSGKQVGPGYTQEQEVALFGAAWGAWEGVFATTPSTAAGRLALVAFAESRIKRDAYPDGSPQDGEETVFADAYRALARAIQAEQPAHAPSDAEAQAVADAIEKLWPEWVALNQRDYHDLSPEAEQRCDAMSERRMALIEAAEDLPATSRTARYAKALALAWYEHVNLWIHRKPLSDYGSDGRLVLDIEASLTGAPAWTGAQA